MNLTISDTLSICSLVATIIIGIIQIKVSRDQKTILRNVNNIQNKISNVEVQIGEVDTKIKQSGSGNRMSGIIGNTTNGSISNNKIG